MTLTDDELRTETFAERRRLADLLGGLTPEQWAHPSLCEGWRVREVVAHITLAYRHSGLRVVAGILASGGNFNRYADKIARKDTATTSDAELLESLRDNAEHPWTPPRGGQAGALAHDVLHGLDITEPLGLQSAPPARIAAAIGDPDKRQLKYFGVDLTGVSLRGTDANITIGDGEPVDLPAKDIALIVGGRRPVPGQ
ncbi:MAG TPA: maleylpyruvate isomerase family mycothiol-dependent enzyme [Gordonia sp. (in: high G+C Gram-positive bacteria)]|uniref:maleylpyruvate isomerase family mycothiol-dependent enzyme n=2 Tax=unclassified Gordonia (in: high G+C Gram-positive bacteria) TaxID=2657482 RepID=UPI000F9B163B|nr:maleylpyruvate isomerase family mycothiol-dependent enzyme [Gordonia sp. (in: high G+C Gram-positive bacteria)]RUP40457.1 MAG: maleylpyruvate isomerase family mycothiol-dependent enzyme [Gordonia sp. (in: high G+C Gram-positive bacteria)]HNP58203.1 maleylpyruvate isomerase family mycothiol-dependent enzyme [Gordonia sp. (in: high G+C Gram-positive bacteria)]HRC51790.1 maleylpyruvate isomerase family mycothiol-dependent enzyme [Gordonia sp. (in: high G+C Gram-positive bacteria)]